MTIHGLRALVHDDFDAVNVLITNNIQSPIDLLDDLANHIIQSGGKRLRPLLVLLASRACLYQGRDHITLAAMMEYFHTATLLHDDVIDESTLRRGRETAHKIWGDKASILVGDYLFAQYMHLMVSVGDLSIMRILTDMADQIACGEIKQLANRHNYSLSVNDYFEVIRLKTSLLFASCAQLGALISHAHTDVREALSTYGLHLGNAFQLKDDALDYCSNAKTMGKNIGDDWVDGKMTMPLLYVLQHGDLAQQQLIKEGLTQGSRTSLPEVLKALADTNAIECTQQLAKNEVARALNALSVVPNSVYKDALVELAEYAILRDH